MILAPKEPVTVCPFEGCGSVRFNGLRKATSIARGGKRFDNGGLYECVNCESLVDIDGAGRAKLKRRPASAPVLPPLGNSERQDPRVPRQLGREPDLRDGYSDERRQ